jgi:DNA-binding MarR family transcriptional regulator
MSDLEQPQLDEAAEQLRRVLRLLHRRAQGPSGPDEPTRSEQGVLGWLQEAGPLNIRTLAALERVRPQSMGQTVHAIQQRGWVTRVPKPGDRRQSLIGLTDAGRRALRIGRELRQRWLVEALATRFSDTERQQLLAAIDLLARIIDEEAAPRSHHAQTTTRTARPTD